MVIDFFEEFPTEENLLKAKLINFPSTVYITAKSLKEFDKIRERLNTINSKLQVGYWPILEKSYWISPFSHTEELKKLIVDLEKRQDKDEPLKILFDFELPLNKNLIFKNAFLFFKNKALIREFLKKAENFNLEIFTAEYPLINKLTHKILEWLGLSFPTVKYKKIMMFYSSMIRNKFIFNQFKNYIVRESKERGINFQVGLGVLATGIHNNESLISVEDLDNDLAFLNKYGIYTAVIFRLGGLNQEYLEIIKKYLINR